MLLLSEKAIDWNSAVWEDDKQLQTYFYDIVTEICEVFENSEGVKDVSVKCCCTIYAGFRFSAQIRHPVQNISVSKWMG